MPGCTTADFWDIQAAAPRMPHLGQQVLADLVDHLLPAQPGPRAAPSRLRVQHSAHGGLRLQANEAVTGVPYQTCRPRPR